MAQWADLKSSVTLVKRVLRVDELLENGEPYAASLPDSKLLLSVVEGEDGQCHPCT